MNIIFRGNFVQEIADRYTLLELDTIRMPDGTETTAYCVVEKIPLSELTRVDELKQLHHDMMQQYKNSDWSTCEKSLMSLIHCWGTEVDSFYKIMLHRVQGLQTNPPGPGWDPIIDKQEF